MEKRGRPPSAREDSARAGVQEQRRGLQRERIDIGISTVGATSGDEIARPHRVGRAHLVTKRVDHELDERRGVGLRSELPDLTVR
jgi:hypothetical protein